VLVPLGRRTETGIVIGPATAQEEVRDAIRLLDEAPLLTAEILELARWAAAHYLAPFGPALKATLPPGMDVRDALAPGLTETGRQALESGQLDLPGQEEALRRLLRKAASGARLSRAQLADLSRRGLVTLRRAESRPRVAQQMVETAEVVAGASDETAGRAPRQAEVLAWLLARAARVPVEEVAAAFPRARPHLRALAARGLVKLDRVPAGPVPMAEAPWGEQRHDPTAAQASALRALCEALDAGEFAPFLLHGVTGSGKTWVYLEAIAHARAAGRGALALVPEIALTPQLAGRFRVRFGDDVAVLHSGLSDPERVAEWQRVRDGRAGIVVGARSAVWAPVGRLGIVVVDEEHEPSYKQEERLRYHARDLALVRAQRAGAVAVLGSATPSLETLRRAQEGKLRTLRLPERVEARPLPAVRVVKRRAADELFTPELAAALTETMARGEQAILFLNRRGHTRTLLCAACGAAAGCPNCSVALVLHRSGAERLRCHLCGHEEPPRRACAACGGGKLIALGAGTEKVEEELETLLPKARAARLDRDSAGGPGQAAAVLARFARRELEVLIGTQMVAKGHDFPGVTLVGVLDADGPMHLPDFRAAERCLQLLTQVSGRAGRGLSPGRVIVQAYKPDAVSLEYDGFAVAELRRREELRFPPFARLCAVRFSGNSETRTRGAAERAAAIARRMAAQGERIDVLGPAPAPIARVRGKHRWQLLLRAADHAPLHRVARALQASHGVAGVQLAVDVDPVALL
jgi:primosomal protein N' (replication factor Y)